MTYRYICGIKVPQVGLGLYSYSGDQLKQTLSHAIFAGYRFFDTAYRYNNEREIGKFFSSVPYDSFRVIVSSKISELQFCGHKRFLYLDRVSIRDALNKYLNNINKESADIYLLHSPFKGYQKAFKELIIEQESGRIRIVGVSGFNEEQLLSLKQSSGIYPQICMMEIHPFHNSNRLVSFCKDNNIEIIARSPFAHGLIIKELEDRDNLKSISYTYKKTIPQLILKWIVQKGIIVIPRSSNPRHLEQNIDIFGFDLSEKEMKVFDGYNSNRSYGVKL